MTDLSSPAFNPASTASTATPAAAELVGRIGWLIRLRWFAVGGVICTVEIGRRLFPVQLPFPALYIVIAALALYNLVLASVVTRLRARSRGQPWRGSATLGRLLVPRAAWGMEGEGEVIQAAEFVNAQISLDLVFLAALLHFSGGVENPFVFFFIFHIVIASILLSRRATYLQATLGLVLISAVAVCEATGVLRHHPLDGVWRPGAFREAALVGAQLFVLAATLYLSAYMGSTIAAHLRKREREAANLAAEVTRKATMLEEAYARLAGTERAKSQYMRKVAHELRGPLGTIKTALRVVLEGLTGTLPEPSRELVERAERRAGELAATTVDLLALSLAREGRLAVEMAPVRVDEVVREAVAESRAAVEKAGILLDVEIAPDAGALRGDAAGLRQLIGNLLSNAVRYTPSRGRVTVRMRRVGGVLRLEVEDTGMGITEVDLPRVFEEFFRAASARGRVAEGTGLGLAIVKAVAEQHGGSVTVASVEGRGTTFTVELPHDGGGPSEEVDGRGGSATG